MANPDEYLDDQDEGLVFLNSSHADPNEDDDADGLVSNVPVVVDLDQLDMTPGRRSIDLDASLDEFSTGSLDLNALIRDFDQTRNKPAKPKAQSSSLDNELDELSIGNNTKEISNSLEVAALKAQLDTERNNYRRATADLINFRRKAEQERERANRDTIDRLIKQLLPIIDDFERSHSAALDSQNIGQILDGVAAILRNFEVFLARFQVVPVETLGKPFDPDVHESVSVEVVDDPDIADDTIVAELRRGYTSNGRLVRAAMVRVARHAPSDEDSALNGAAQLQDQTAQSLEDSPSAEI